MKKLNELQTTGISILFTDIDDTMTNEGTLPANSYEAIWRLHENGIQIIPVTGRPAGWCEMIARLWPVSGVIGENGGFYFAYDRSKKKMQRHFAASESQRLDNRKKLKKIESEVLQSVPKTAVASDQFCRLMDLAIDFCEDVEPLTESDIEKIVQIFEKHGATAKISSIHVNGWFGSYDKLSMCKFFLQEELGIAWKDRDKHCAFIGDSPNDEPLFAGFANSVAVTNIQPFLAKLSHPPKFITKRSSSDGFCELADHLLRHLLNSF